MEYLIVKGNEKNKFELINKHGVWALHFKRRLKQPGIFELIIHGSSSIKPYNENEVYERPLTLKVKLIVVE